MSDSIKDALLLRAGGPTGIPPTGAVALFADTDGQVKSISSDGIKIGLDFSGFKRAANLGDADVTLQPFTDKCSVYILPPNTLTANRTITLGNTSAPGAGLVWVCAIVRLDRGAFTLTIKKADTTTIYTDPISPAYNTQMQFGCNNGVWGVSEGIIIP